jgi:Zn-dependent protease
VSNQQISDQSPFTGIHLFTLQQTPFLMKLNAIPGSAAIFAILLKLVRNSHPHLPRRFRWLLALIWFAMFEATYVLHCLGHILSARAAGAPVDAVVNIYGLQPALYRNNRVTPEQHMGRAIGGPVMTLTVAGSAYVVWRALRRIPMLNGLAETWFAFNALGLLVALAPSPQFDGGTLIKWAVTARTGEIALGEEAVQEAGYLAAFGLMLAASILAFRRKWTLALAVMLRSILIVVDLVSSRR